MAIDFNQLLTVTFTLFAVIDIVGSVPILISLKQKMGGINEFRATLVSGGLMVLFLFCRRAIPPYPGAGCSILCSWWIDRNFYSRVGDGIGSRVF